MNFHFRFLDRITYATISALEYIEATFAIVLQVDILVQRKKFTPNGNIFLFMSLNAPASLKHTGMVYLYLFSTMFHFYLATFKFRKVLKQFIQTKM